MAKAPNPTKPVRDEGGPVYQALPSLQFEPIPPAPGSQTAPQPNPRILEAVEPIARNLVLQGAKAGEPEPYAFGRTFARPLVIGADDSGDALVLDLMWSRGEVSNLCNGFGGFAKAIYMPDIGPKSVTSGVLHEHFVGTAGQSASTIMTALKGSYDALPNIAHSVITMQDGWNLNLACFMDGVLVTDPRTSPYTTAWTENPALILADILVRCGYSPDWASVADVADWCDEGLDDFESPLSERFKVHGHIRNRAELRYYVHMLAQYCGAYIDIRGGSAIFVTDKPRASNHTVTVADMLEGTERLRRRGSKDKPARVEVTFEGGFGTSATIGYGTSTGPGSVTALSMPHWKNHYCAGRKALEVYNKAQNALESLEFISRDHSLIRTLGDVGTITHSALGLSSQLMALVENEPVDRGRWRRKYVPYAAADYPDAITGTDYGDPDETVQNPFFPPAGPTPVLSFDVVTTDSPNWQRIKIDFSPQTWAYLKDYKVTVHTTADPTTILYSEYIAKGSETGSPLTITTYTDFATDFTGSPQNVYQVNVYLRSFVTDWAGNEVLGEPGTATIDNSYVATAKWFGSSQSPVTDYYWIPNNESPRGFNALIPATGPTDYLTDFTLVFAVYTNSHGRDIFHTVSSAGDHGLFIGSNSINGQFEMNATDQDGQGVYCTVPSDLVSSPIDQYQVFKPGQWVAVMIAHKVNATSPESNSVKIYANGSEVNNYNTTSMTSGAFVYYTAGSPLEEQARSNLLPMAVYGAVYAGAEDNGPGMDCYISHVWCKSEYLDPATNWSKFFDASNKPIDLGADGSTPTGVAPESFFPDADFTNNRGTGPNWTEVGSVPNAPSSPTD